MSLVQETRVERPRRRSDNWFVPRAFGHRRGWKSTALFHTLNTISNIFRQHYDPSGCPTHVALHDDYHIFPLFFPNPDDIGIWGLSTEVPNTAAIDVMLIPFSTPKLRGRLALGAFSWVETLTHVIASCGGRQFRCMELHASISCVPTPLEACAETWRC